MPWLESPRNQPKRPWARAVPGLHPADTASTTMIQLVRRDMYASRSWRNSNWPGQWYAAHRPELSRTRCFRFYFHSQRLPIPSTQTIPTTMPHDAARVTVASTITIRSTSTGRQTFEWVARIALGDGQAGPNGNGRVLENAATPTVPSLSSSQPPAPSSQPPTPTPRGAGYDCEHDYDCEHEHGKILERVARIALGDGQAGPNGNGRVLENAATPTVPTTPTTPITPTVASLPSPQPPAPIFSCSHRRHRVNLAGA